MTEFTSREKVIDFKTPIFPAYTLQFNLEFCLEIK